MLMSKKTTGFTIVELLIVIVVIGILAAITIVAYNGMQAKARFSVYKTDIASLNKAILIYAASNGAYPSNGASGSCWTNQGTGTGDFIPGLVPAYLSQTPPTANWSSGANYYAYCWSTNGADYKIMRLVPSGSVPSNELDGSVAIDPNRGNRAWGYWSAGGAGL
jgi:prepilin-type N-terminal cleavage/methylation domain-containing protein